MGNSALAETPWREKADVEIFWAIRHRTDLDRQQGLMALNHNRKTRFTLETLPERPADPGQHMLQTFTPNGGSSALPGKRKSTPRSRPRPIPNTFTTSPMKTRAGAGGRALYRGKPSPHRVPAVDVDDSLFDELEAAEGRRQKDAVGGGEAADFVAMVLDNLRRSGVQQAHKADRLVFSSIAVWPGRFLVRRRAAIV
jgi:adenine-specific DNA-methyltransferase